MILLFDCDALSSFSSEKFGSLGPADIIFHDNSPFATDRPLFLPPSSWHIKRSDTTNAFKLISWDH